MTYDTFNYITIKYYNLTMHCLSIYLIKEINFSLRFLICFHLMKPYKYHSETAIVIVIIRTRPQSAFFVLILSLPIWFP